MKDFAGNELEIGQKVICLKAGSSTSWMVWGEVIGFTPQKVRINARRTVTYSDNSVRVYDNISLREPKNVVIPMTPKVTNFLMSAGLIGRRLIATDEDLTYLPE